MISHDISCHILEPPAFYLKKIGDIIENNLNNLYIVFIVVFFEDRSYFSQNSLSSYSLTVNQKIIFHISKSYLNIILLADKIFNFKATKLLYFTVLACKRTPREDDV